MYRYLFVGLLMLAGCGSTTISDGINANSSDGPFVGFTPTGAMYSSVAVTPETAGGLLSGTLGTMLLANGALACSDANVAAPLSSGKIVAVAPIVFSPNNTVVDVTVEQGTYSCDPSAIDNTNTTLRIAVVAVIDYSVTPPKTLASASGSVSVDALSSTRATMTYDVVMEDGSTLSGHVTAPLCSKVVTRATALGTSKIASEPDALLGAVLKILHRP